MPRNLSDLSRFCFALALGQLLSVPVLYLGFPFQTFFVVILVSGSLNLALGLLDGRVRPQWLVPVACMGVLILEVTYFFAREDEAMSPVVMLYPLLCSLACPLLGRRGGYATAGVSSAAISACYFLFFSHSIYRLPSLILIHVALLLSAHFSEQLWSGIMRKEHELEIALGQVEKKEQEMESWIERLGKASTLINAGRFVAALPEPPPSHVFDELTKNLEQMRDKLAQYFASVLLKDRLSGLGVLATGVAHEINTPLTTMNFLLSLDSTLSPETKDLLSREINRLSAISKRLMTFARPKAEERCNLNEVISLLRPRLDSFRAQLSVWYELCETELWVRGSANQLQHCILDLFQNSVDALEGVGQPWIELRTYEEVPGLVVLEIKDNGCGIPAELLGKVMEPFFTTKSPGRGTGLGLFVVHQVLSEHGAVMEISSEPKVGTTVSMVFPKLMDASLEQRAA